MHLLRKPHFLDEFMLRFRLGAPAGSSLRVLEDEKERDDGCFDHVLYLSLAIFMSVCVSFFWRTICLPLGVSKIRWHTFRNTDSQGFLTLTAFYIKSWKTSFQNLFLKTSKRLDKSSSFVLVLDNYKKMNRYNKSSEFCSR